MEISGIVEEGLCSQVCPFNIGLDFFLLRPPYCLKKKGRMRFFNM
jgi:hypothetical protein